MSTPSDAASNASALSAQSSAQSRGSRSSRSAGRSGRHELGRPPAQSGRGRRASYDELADAEAFAGPVADPESVARTILLDQLTGRARSRAELWDKLAARDVPEDVATRLLDRFTEVGLVDDEAFARAWVESRQSGKGLARRALAVELRRKGVDDEITREVLAEVDPADEEESARLLVRRRLRSMSRLDHTTRTRRLVGLLSRKGYPAGLAYVVVREELAACASELASEVADDPDGDAGWLG